MRLDVLFIDPVSPWPYDTVQIEKGFSGGSETCITYIAEGLSNYGLEVGVIQFHEFEPVMGHKVVYMPDSYLEKISAAVVIHQRSIKCLPMFPNARNFIWLHDLGVKEIFDGWKPYLDKYRPIMVCITEWHKKQVQSVLDYDNIIVIRSPVEDSLYVPETIRPQYDKNMMIWMSSPHKGLKEAIPVFSRIRQNIPELKLIVTNPGYVKDEYIEAPNVILRSRIPRNEPHALQQHALCLFYPTQYEETLGFVAAESNALGVPVASYEVAALPEVVTHKLCKDEEHLIKKVTQWHNGERPIVHGNEKFRASRVVKEWLRAFNGA